MEKLNLPEIDELELVTDSENVQKSLAKTQSVLNRLMQNIIAFQEIEKNNKKLRYVLLNNQEIIKNEFHKKLEDIKTNFSKRQEITEQNHMHLLKEHENVKLKFNNKLTHEKNRYGLLKGEHNKLRATFKKLGEEYLIIRETNKKVIKRLTYLEQKSLANENLLDERTDVIRAEFEKKVRDVVKEQMKREIKYHVQLDSLNNDLKKYYSSSKALKEKYHNRELEIREKLKELNKTLLDK